MVRSLLGNATIVLALAGSGAATGLLVTLLMLHATGIASTTGTPPVAQSNCLNGPGNSAYAVLATNRADVLQFYAKNGWDANQQCRQIFDNWLAQGPDGLPPLSAGQYGWVKGWLTASGEARDHAR